MSGTGGKRGRRAVSISQLRRTYREVDERERLSLVAHHFCNGKTPSQIGELLEAEYGGPIRREEPYRLLQVAAVEGYFHYSPPRDVRLGESLTSVRGVQQAHVVSTAVIDDVTARAAEVLLDLIRQEWRRKREDHAKTGVPAAEEAGRVRIGLAGGYTVRGIVHALVGLLEREDPSSVPPSLGFHTVCTGIHLHDSLTDPNAFVTHLLGVPTIDTETFAVTYQAPPITRPEVRKVLEHEQHMIDAKGQFELVDILVTSGSSWRVKEVTDQGEIRAAPEVLSNHDGRREEPKSHSSQLKALMQKYDPDGYQELMNAHVVADTLWQPLSFDGPIEIETQVEAMTLLRLGALPEFMASDKKVLLALGPHSTGLFHKGDVLLAALGGPGLARTPLFTHLVCDHRTAGAAVRAIGLDERGAEDGTEGQDGGQDE